MMDRTGLRVAGVVEFWRDQLEEEIGEFVTEVGVEGAVLYCENGNTFTARFDPSDTSADPRLIIGAKGWGLLPPFPRWARTV